MSAKGTAWRKPRRVMPVEELTPREMDVLLLLGEGLGNAEIGARLCTSWRTVRDHVGNILHKLHATNRTQAIVIAYRVGLLELCRERDNRLTATEALALAHRYLEMARRLMAQE